MTVDLVSRLRAAIDEVEQPTLKARGDQELRWTMGATTDVWSAACRHCDWSDEGLEHEVNPRADEHARTCARMPVSEVLRMCQAHRDILDLHKIGSDPCDAHDASGSSIPCEVVELLARGYGVEDQ